MCDESEKTVGSACDAGYYYRAASGAIAFAVGDARFVFRDGDKLRAERLPSVYFEWLRDCDGFDWQPPQPIDPGEGWRLLGESEPVKAGDECRLRIGFNRDIWTCSINWEGSGEQSSECVYRRRIAPTYRPFASAAEFEPHRERWVCLKQKDSWRGHFSTYYDHGAWFTTDASGSSVRTWQDLYRDYTFEEGTPFGIEETP